MIPFCNWSFRSAFNVIGNASFTGQVETTDCDFYWRLNRSVLPIEIPDFIPLHRFVFRNKGNKPLLKQCWACQQFEILFKIRQNSREVYDSSSVFCCLMMRKTFRKWIFLYHNLYDTLNFQRRRTFRYFDRSDTSLFEHSNSKFHLTVFKFH